MSNIRPIAIYLPQYHTIPENNAAWGEGFTEWTNVKKAVPLFEGHYQPHVPHESIGYYDLRDPEVLVKQAAMASEYGIYGFAFYHYWFNGKQLLNSPIDNLLATGKPDFPFCLIWANENWTKKWDGLDQEIIIKQEYSFIDDKAHMEFLCKNVFVDKRYIRIKNKPVFIVYRTELFPDIQNTAKIWQQTAMDFGFDGLYLIRVERFDIDTIPSLIGFDAAMEFAPVSRSSGINSCKIVNDNYILDYDEKVLDSLCQKKTDYKLFRNVFPGWDNYSRRQAGAYLFEKSSPEMFEYYLRQIISYTKSNFPEDEQYFFINAWNEWGEGCHIEPDEKYGFQYLKSCKRAINGSNMNTVYDDYVTVIEKLIISKMLEINKLKEEISGLRTEIVKQSKASNLVLSLFLKAKNKILRSAKK
jgi:lipopolysaccharide biosynthesis protein